MAKKTKKPEKKPKSANKAAKAAPKKAAAAKKVAKPAKKAAPVAKKKAPVKESLLKKVVNAGIKAGIKAVSKKEAAKDSGKKVGAKIEAKTESKVDKKADAKTTAKAAQAEKKAAAKLAAEALKKGKVKDAPVVEAKGKKGKKTQPEVVEVEDVQIEFKAPVKDIVLTDAEGRELCRVKDCDQPWVVENYCRYHYLLFWKKIQNRKKILSEGKLEQYIEELTSRYPLKFLELIRKDLSSEPDFFSAIQELDIDESNNIDDFEDENFMEEVRGISSGETERVDDEY